MKKYNCSSCGFHTNHKPNFQRHLETKKHMKSTKSQSKVNLESTFSQPLVNQKSTFLHEKEPQQFQCKYCAKNFKFKQSMYKHIKYVCKKNKDEDFQELARLMNAQAKQLTAKNTEMNTMQKEMVQMQKQISKLTNKLQIQNINNGKVHNGNNNTVNIQLLNHSDTDYSHLTSNDYIHCIKNCNKCVKTLIEKVHFNTEKPENMNIYLSNIKGKYIMIYKDNTWQIQDRKRQLDALYDNNEIVLETWYDEYKEKYPNIIQSFQRYLHNRDGDVVLNRIKEEILIMLYNKRKMIPMEG